MRNCTKNTAIATQQLQLFTSPPSPDDEPPAYALQIGYIPDKQRVTPDKFCKLIHHGSGLTIGGQFSYSEASEILETTRSLLGLGVRQAQDTEVCGEIGLFLR